MQLGEKRFEPLTCGFGDHCFTIGTIFLRKKLFLVYGICTYLHLFSNKIFTFLDVNWCFFFICFFFQVGLSKEIVSLRMWFWSSCLLFHFSFLNPWFVIQIKLVHVQIYVCPLFWRFIILVIASKYILFFIVYFVPS